MCHKTTIPFGLWFTDLPAGAVRGKVPSGVSYDRALPRELADGLLGTDSQHISAEAEVSTSCWCETNIQKLIVRSFLLGGHW